ncbi:hypothetical protein PAMP_000628 [Pampus punctatissimus]
MTSPVAPANHCQLYADAEGKVAVCLARPYNSHSLPSVLLLWSKRRGSSVQRLVLPKATGVCSNTGAEGLLLGALRDIPSVSVEDHWKLIFPSSKLPERD